MTILNIEISLFVTVYLNIKAFIHKLEALISLNEMLRLQSLFFLLTTTAINIHKIANCKLVITISVYYFYFSMKTSIFYIKYIVRLII